jgi:hypothetical protein
MALKGRLDAQENFKKKVAKFGLDYGETKIRLELGVRVQIKAMS